jgi:UV DNA damage endonuclease
MKINLGLCCINTELREKDIFCSRTTIREGFTLDKARDLALKNVSCIEPILEWNAKNGIYCYRLSSDMFPHITDPETPKYTIDFAEQALRSAGIAARRYNQRIVMHPGQYNQLAAVNPLVLKKTFEDLTIHAKILQLMGTPHNTSVIIIHGGGTYGDKKAAIKRWVQNFNKLPLEVRRRIVIENDEKSYSIEDVLQISKECGIPVVFDLFHHECYQKYHPEYKGMSPMEAFVKSCKTWENRGCRPLMHISEQMKNSPVGTHSNYITKGLPDWLREGLKKFDSKWVLDLEVEAKQKERAIKLLKYYENKRDPEWYRTFFL